MLELSFDQWDGLITLALLACVAMWIAVVAWIFEHRERTER